MSTKSKPASKPKRVKPALTTEARHSSASVEHHTPASIVEPARLVLGSIHTDPFSCAAAQRTVRASQFFDGSLGLDGWKRSWSGRVFCNPPGGHVDREGQRVIKATKTSKGCAETGACGLPPGHKHDGCESAQKRAWFRLMGEDQARRVSAAIFVCFSVELLQSTQTDTSKLPLPLDFPICYPRTRIAYLRPDGTVGKQPPHSSCLILVPPKLDCGGGEMIDTFRGVFSALGKVVVPR